jgi:pSer/pThr/pTyr-binding forkhead associated (FHA) protein
VIGDSPLGLHRASPVELAERLAAERRGGPFLLYRDGAGSQRIVELTEQARISLGRSASCDVALTWDGEVSRLHAQLERVGSRWVVVDDGLSSNGTFVAGARVSGRRPLGDGDLLQLGATVLAFRQPDAVAAETTGLSDQRAARVTEAQRRVLVALCRPLQHQPAAAVPATNPQIAAELQLSVAAVKTHMHALFRTFGIDDLAQQEKRRTLVALALASGLVREREL